MVPQAIWKYGIDLKNEFYKKKNFWENQNHLAFETKFLFSIRNCIQSSCGFDKNLKCKPIYSK